MPYFRLRAMIVQYTLHVRLSVKQNGSATGWTFDFGSTLYSIKIITTMCFKSFLQKMTTEY